MELVIITLRMPTKSDAEVIHLVDTIKTSGYIFKFSLA